jgi:TDG/mug DNA glycosylase family protein
VSKGRGPHDGVKWRRHTGGVSDDPQRPWKPTREQLQAANDAAIPDLIAPDLRVLFCGINPGLYSGATGRHFARPGNRFWPALHRSGFTDRLLTPWDDAAMLERGLGITNLVNRTTATAAELDEDELRAGGARLIATAERYRPRYVAVVGVTSYRIAFQRPKAVIGPQDEPIRPARVWVLPNPSGLNAHYQLPELGEVFADLRRAVEADVASDPTACGR